MDKRVIIDTLEPRELDEVIKTDFPALIYQAATIETKAKKTIIARKQKAPLYFAPARYDGKTGITWHIRLWCKSYADYKKKGPLFLYYGTFQYRGKLYAAQVCDNMRHVVLYGWHLFQRYNERALNGTAETTADAMHEYFKRNSISAPQPQPERENGVFAPTEQGAALGEYDDGVLFYKTFITSEMLKGDQVEGHGAAIWRIEQRANKN